MKKTWQKIAITLLGPICGGIAFQLSGPWWVYFVALTLFLLGLVSFSYNSEVEKSGYETRVDDGRAHSPGYETLDGGEI